MFYFVIFMIFLCTVVSFLVLYLFGFSEEEAKKKMFSVSTQHHYFFVCNVPSEIGVLFICVDQITLLYFFFFAACRGVATIRE